MLILAKLGFNTKDLIKNTRTDIAEYVTDALATNQKIPMIEKIKVDHTKKIDKIYELNRLKAQRHEKQQKLKKLKEYSDKLEKQISCELPLDVSNLTTLQRIVSET
jgi:hypothetical protein